MNGAGSCEGVQHARSPALDWACGGQVEVRAEEPLSGGDGVGQLFSQVTSFSLAQA